MLPGSCVELTQDGSNLLCVCVSMYSSVYLYANYDDDGGDDDDGDKTILLEEASCCILKMNLLSFGGGTPWRMCVRVCVDARIHTFSVFYGSSDENILNKKNFILQIWFKICKYFKNHTSTRQTERLTTSSFATSAKLNQHLQREHLVARWWVATSAS